MNPERFANAPSGWSLLNIVQRGTTQQWQELYELCHDLNMASQLAAILPLRDPDLMPSARLWKFLLEDLHPQLKIELNENQRDIGV